MRRFFLTPQRLLLLFLLIVAGAAGIYFFQPLSLPALPEETVQVEVSSSRLQPYDIQQEEYILTPDSPQWLQMEEIFSSLTFHRCVQTLSGSTSTGGTGGRVLNFYGRNAEHDLLWDVTITASCHLRVGDLVYHLGWWGDEQGQQLANGLAQILEGS